MTANPNYIRVAANVFDSYSTIDDVYSVAFETEVTADETANVIAFVQARKDDSDKVVCRMFNPVDGSETTSAFGQTIHVISYNTKAYANVDTTVYNSIVSDTPYYTYIYTRNGSGYERVQITDSTTLSSS